MTANIPGSTPQENGSSLKPTQISELKWASIPPDYKDVWSTERTDWADWEKVRDQYMGKRTLAREGALWVEGISFEIVPTKYAHSAGEWAAEAALSSDVSHIRNITADGKIIASVRHRVEHSQDEALANARLMANASDLLKEADLLLASLKGLSIHGSHYAALSAVVKKAKGE